MKNNKTETFSFSSNYNYDNHSGDALKYMMSGIKDFKKDGEESHFYDQAYYPDSKYMLPKEGRYSIVDVTVGGGSSVGVSASGILFLNGETPIWKSIEDGVSDDFRKAYQECLNGINESFRMPVFEDECMHSWK